MFEKKIKVAVKIKNEPQELLKIYEIYEKIKEKKIEETKAKEKNKEKSWT